MSETDARFEDARGRALHLKALGPEDLQVISALAQDAVFPAGEMTWQSRPRRFAVLLNRFHWEDAIALRQPERVQSLLVIDNAMKVASQGVGRDDRDVILSLLSIGFEAGPDGTGAVILTLAGDGAIRVQVEALDVTLKDVTKPYIAPSKSVPSHPE